MQMSAKPSAQNEHYIGSQRPRRGYKRHRIKHSTVFTDLYFFTPASATPVKHRCVALLYCRMLKRQTGQRVKSRTTSTDINASYGRQYFSIQNELLHVSVAAKGAELQSLIHKKIWYRIYVERRPKILGKKSPVLFPVVGGLKQNHYTYNNIQYELGRHGFARDMDFDIAEQTENSLTFY